MDSSNPVASRILNAEWRQISYVDSSIPPLEYQYDDVKAWIRDMYIPARFEQQVIPHWEPIYIALHLVTELKTGLWPDKVSGPGASVHQTQGCFGIPSSFILGSVAR